MATLATDVFTGTDADLGTNWTAIRDSWKRVSDTAQPNSLSTDSTEMYDGGVTWPNDQWVQAAITGTGGAASSGSGPGLALRCAAGGNCYRVCVSVGGANNVIEVGVMNPTFTSLGFRDTTWTSGQVLKVEIQGYTLKVYKDDVQVGADIVDGGSSLASGKPGVYYSSTMDTASLDNWSAGGFAGAAQTICPDADITTTGWTSTPLWSKIGTPADATIVTATAA